MELKEFSARLSQLRLNKGVSARDMSLSIGQSQSYINNIENGVAFPSMTVFFYICEYLNITPAEFFDTASSNPTKEKELLSELKGLRTEDMDALIALAKSLKKK
ncbi:MAG: helix-turn-helix transcriptional regulator [Ruminococcaceae bacterium]|nr:helix-turn-helix transcriptional regulator [Oscillospiraceae bacterium]